MNKRIEIVVDGKGSTNIETKGFAGGDCIEASRFIEQALGKKSREQKTPEFYASTSEKAHQNQHES